MSRETEVQRDWPNMVQQLQKARTLCSNLSTRDTLRTQTYHMFQLQRTRTLCKQLSRKDEEQDEQAYEGSQSCHMCQMWKQRTPCGYLPREVSPRSQEGQYVIFVWKFL